MKQPYQKVNQKFSFKEIVWNNFIGGIAWGLGATVGISLIFALLGILAKSIDLVPLVGSFTSDVINFILAHNNALQK